MSRIFLKFCYGYEHLEHIFNRRAAESAEFFSGKTLESLRSLRLRGVQYLFAHYNFSEILEET